MKLAIGRGKWYSEWAVPTTGAVTACKCFWCLSGMALDRDQLGSRFWSRAGQPAATMIDRPGSCIQGMRLRSLRLWSYWDQLLLQPESQRQRQILLHWKMRLRACAQQVQLELQIQKKNPKWKKAQEQPQPQILARGWQEGYTRRDSQSLCSCALCKTSKETLS